jgi:hypothetical protein
MKAANIPAKFALPFAENATSGYIRTIPTTTVDPNAASLSLGFPPNTAVPVAAGGTPPNIEDFNGVLNQTSAWDQWFSAGAPVFYDGTFSTAIGGYPKGTVLSNVSTNGAFWISTVDDNTTNPDTGGANWSGYTLTGLGTAAYKAASNNSDAAVASVTGAVTTNHLVVFADSSGSIKDGGPVSTLGTAAAKNASDNGQSIVASVSGGTTTNNFASFNDGSGTVKDSGYRASSFDASGAAAAAQSAAQTYALGVANAAQVNAQNFATAADIVVTTNANAYALSAANTAYNNAIAVSLLRGNNLSDLTNTSVARSNLGLGSAAVYNASGGNGNLAGIASAAAGNVVGFADSNGTIRDTGIPISSLLSIAASFANPGYAKIGPLLLQWGTASVNIAGTSYVVSGINFPTTFPNGCYSVVAVCGTNDVFNPFVAGNNMTAITFNISNDGFYARLDTEQGRTPYGSVPVSWFAIGN